MKTIVVICPVYNEENNIEYFYRSFCEVFEKISNYSFKILFSDNCSTDGSYKIIQKIAKDDQRVSCISFSKNYGVMKSIYTSFHYIDGDACAIFDCDLQDPPELLIELIKGWEEGNRIVYGKRNKRKEKKIFSFFRILQRKLEIIFKGKQTSVESGAWFLDKIAVEQLKLSKFDPYLPGMIDRLGFERKAVDYQRKDRKFGKTKFSFSMYAKYGLDGLISGNRSPLKISIYFSIIYGIFCLLSGIYFLYAKFVRQIEFGEGVAAILIIILLSFSLIFFTLSIFGEYIGRLYFKDEDEKLAIVEKQINQKHK
tara:strand:- start:599 stop:1531 length:933 start_codon:yes stop_codon:yes gene_type:complete